MRAARRALLVLTWAALGGCSADAVTPPEAKIERPGSFVAFDEDGAVALIRTLRVVPIDDTDSLLEAITYQAGGRTYEEARERARDPSLPIFERHSLYSLSAISSRDPEVVWFRTLTESELSALR
jgi:hypothetical protein